MCFGTNKTRHPAQPIAKQNVPDVCRVHPKDFPVLILTHMAEIYISKLFFYQKIKFQERKR
jgi:hypothetical protein